MAGVLIVVTLWCRWAARGSRRRSVGACPSGRWPARPEGGTGEGTSRRLGMRWLVRGRVGPVFDRSVRLVFSVAATTALASIVSTTVWITMVPLARSTWVWVWWARPRAGVRREKAAPRWHR